MKISKNTPAFVRYFKARLQPFTKPLFLGSFGGLLIAGLAIYQYWRHPEWLQTNFNNTTQPIAGSQTNLQNTSPEDLSIAADIDNVDLLLKELQQNQVSQEGVTAPNQIQLQNKDSQYSRLQKSQKAKLQKPNSLPSEENAKSSELSTGNQKIVDLLQPSSLSSYQSPNVPVKKFKTSKPKVIPNPIGNAYLSNRQRKSKLNSLKKPAISSAQQNNKTNTVPQLNSDNRSNDFVNNTSETSNITNTFIPASSVIQSQQTPSAPVSNSNVSSPTGFNLTNPYLGTGFNNRNSYSSGSTNSLNQNGISPSSVNNVPNLSTGSTPTNRNTFINNGNNAPNSLQNNYRNNQLVSPNYSRSAPSNYQSQPQSYTQNNFLRRNNGLSSTPTVSNVDVNNNSNSLNQQTNNSSISNSYRTPSLQPSGVLTTGEIRR